MRKPHGSWVARAAGLLQGRKPRSRYGRDGNKAVPRVEFPRWETYLGSLDKADQKLLGLMTKRVGVALRLQRLNAVVRSTSGSGQFMLWEIER
jgi:hypothetical protein